MLHYKVMSRTPSTDSAEIFEHMRQFFVAIQKKAVNEVNIACKNDEDGGRTYILHRSEMFAQPKARRVVCTLTFVNSDTPEIVLDIHDTSPREFAMLCGDFYTFAYTYYDIATRPRCLYTCLMQKQPGE